MTENEKLKLIFDEAYKFLLKKLVEEGKLDKSGAEKILRNQLDYYLSYKPNNMTVVFKRMVESLKNKQGYKNFIADTRDMNKILFSFDPKRVFEYYGFDWKKLFKNFERKFGKRYKMNIDNQRSSWVIFTKGVISASNFCKEFKNVKNLDTFIKTFLLNEYTTAALPMLLEKEIYGFGFPLACDFLKELGYPDFGKPDVHLKDIFYELGLVERYDDYEVFKVIVKIGKATGERPVIVDKVFWLIGSGSFYDSNIKIPRMKKDFITYIRTNFLA